MDNVTENVEEFADSIGIDIERFVELSELVDVITRLNEGAEYGYIMEKCVGFCMDQKEAMFVGMILGRNMQAELCSKCDEEDDSPRLVVVCMPVRKP